MCGQLFCATHSAKRAFLLRPDTSLVKERVCDLCHPLSADVDIVTPPESRRNSLSSDPSETPLTPSSEHPPLTASLVLRSSSSRHLPVEETKPTALTPLEPWMGPEGVLSLSPLAIKPSPSSSTLSIAPLFPQPRKTVRRRRLGKGEDLWIPGKWGYKREDFDLSYRDEEDDLESLGGLVEDGPIRFRAQRRVTSPVGGNNQSSERMSLSTF